MSAPPTIPPVAPVPLPYASLPGNYVPTPDECTTALFIHLGLLFHTVGLVIALVLWLTKKDQSAFINHHGKQAISLFVSTFIAALVCIPLCFVCVGFFLLVGLGIFHVVLAILGAVAAHQGRWYRYPLVGNIIK